uniref:Uncharacterized protein n=1 Tax=Lepeophtheirus salmonis TaxID=72036 RepID=A0A0K2UH15_LEPSM
MNYYTLERRTILIRNSSIFRRIKGNESIQESPNPKKEEKRSGNDMANKTSHVYVMCLIIIVIEKY